MTPQEVFNKVVTHLRTQGCKAQHLVSPGTVTQTADYVCRYRQQTDTHTFKCAVGCLIPDEEYRTDMEGHGLDSLLESGLLTSERQKEFFQHRRLLQALQQIHDYNPVKEWEKEFRKEAEERGLQLPDGLPLPEK